MKFLLMVLLALPLTSFAEYDLPQCKTEKKYYTMSIDLYINSMKLYIVNKKLYARGQISESKLLELLEKAEHNQERVFAAQHIYTTCQKKYRVTM